VGCEGFASKRLQVGLEHFRPSCLVLVSVVDDSARVAFGCGWILGVRRASSGLASTQEPFDSSMTASLAWGHPGAERRKGRRSLSGGAAAVVG